MNAPFDLDRAIQLWREQLAHSPAVDRDNLDELESHLRDAVSGLKARGLSEEESFLVAARRMGWLDVLGEEFGKANPAALWRDRALWMLAGMLFLNVGWDFVRAIVGAVGLVGSRISSNGFLLGTISGGVQIIAFTLLAFVFWRIANGRFSGFRQWSAHLGRRPVLSVIAVILGLALVQFAGGVFRALYIRNLPPEALGQSYLTFGWIAAFMPTLQLVLMVVVFAKLWQGQTRRVAGSRLATWALLLPVTLGLTLASASAQPKSDLTGDGAVAKPALATLDQSMTLWRAGKKDDAAAKFFAVDFSKRPLFPAGSVLNYTEAQFIALPQAARDKMAKPMQDDIQTLKQIAAHIRDAGEAAQSAGDKAKATKCTGQLLKCGDAFDQSDSLALLKLVGKAFKKMAITAPK